jgi:hypothetical protein
MKATEPTVSRGPDLADAGKGEGFMIARFWKMKNGNLPL